MTRLKKLVIAAVLLGAAFAFKPQTVEAIDWCRSCDATGACFECCKCEGNTTYYCAAIACP